MPGTLTLSTAVKSGRHHLLFIYEKPLCFCRLGPGRGGGTGDSSLPVVSERRGERANELMSAKCFEDEKAFSCVQHRRY